MRISFRLWLHAMRFKCDTLFVRVYPIHYCYIIKDIILRMMYRPLHQHPSKWWLSFCCCTVLVYILNVISNIIFFYTVFLCKGNFWYSVISTTWWPVQHNHDIIMAFVSIFLSSFAPFAVHFVAITMILRPCLWFWIWIPVYNMQSHYYYTIFKHLNQNSKPYMYILLNTEIAQVSI